MFYQNKINNEVEKFGFWDAVLFLACLVLLTAFWIGLICIVEGK